MEKIVSKNNQKIKDLRKLNDKKYRQSLGLFKIENIKIIQDAFIAGFEPKKLFLTSKNKKLFDNFHHTEIFEINEDICQSVSELDNPPGVIAVYQLPKGKLDLSENLVYLNNINNPGNLGTIFRTGVAFGFKNFILDETCADIFNQKTIQASKDAIFKINFVYDNKIKHLQAIKKTHQLVATTMKGEKIKKINKQFCLILGNESHGIDQEILAMTDHQVTIPINSDMESLNVAIAAGIIFHQLKS